MLFPLEYLIIVSISKFSQRSRHKLGQLHEGKVSKLARLGCSGFGESQKERLAIPFYIHSNYLGKREVESHILPFKDARGRAGDPPDSDCSIRDESEPPSPEETAGLEKGDLKSKSLKDNKRDAPARTATPSPTLVVSASKSDSTSELDTKKQCAWQDGEKKNSFNDMLKQLEAYQYVFGIGCSVPKPDGDGGKLGRWLAFQRRQFLAGKLDKERVEKLRSIGRKEFSEEDLVVRAAEQTAANRLDL